MDCETMKTSNARPGFVISVAIVLVCAMCGNNQKAEGPVGTGGSASTGGLLGAGGEGTAISTGHGGAVGKGGSVGPGGAIDAGGAVGEGGSVGRGGAFGSGGAVGTGGFVGTGGVVGSGGLAPAGGHAKGGAIGTGGSGGGVLGAGGALGIDGGSSSTNPCDSPGLTWKTGSKTNYTSYPDPGSDECVLYSGCEYEGLFSACEQKRSVEWVEAHNIAAVFPDFRNLKLHDLCLKSGTKTIVVTVLDECADSDCSGCCTENKGSADQLIDIESFTDARWGVEDGRIQWADLGPTKGSGCQ
jgi:hypothetical protein